MISIILAERVPPVVKILCTIIILPVNYAYVFTQTHATGILLGYIKPSFSPLSLTQVNSGHCAIPISLGTITSRARLEAKALQLKSEPDVGHPG